MAAEKLREVLSMLVVSVTTLFTMPLKMSGLLQIALRLMTQQRQLLISAMKSRKKNVYLRKLKRLRERPLYRKKRSMWFHLGCTDL